MSFAPARGGSDHPGGATRTEKAGGAGGRKKLTEFNKFMQTEVARLKQENPDMPHKDRCGTSVVADSLGWKELMAGWVVGSSSSSTTGTSRRRPSRRSPSYRPPSGTSFDILHFSHFSASDRCECTYARPVVVDYVPLCVVTLRRPHPLA